MRGDPRVAHSSTTFCLYVCIYTGGIGYLVEPEQRLFHLLVEGHPPKDLAVGPKLVTAALHALGLPATDE